MAASGLSWFETREDALLTMKQRPYRQRRCSHSHDPDIRDQPSTTDVTA